MKQALSGRESWGYAAPMRLTFDFSQQDSLRDEDKLDVQAMKEILARESKR
jgi:hypothetical protein